MALLLALLVVAYIGSLWASARGGRSFGSASGAEYVVLGCLLGPRVLGVVGDEALRSFEPVAHVALAWIALGYGLECGMVGDRPARLSRNLLAIVFTAVTACTAGAAVYFVGSRLEVEARPSLAVLSVALGLVSAETTRHALRWVTERHLVRGPLTELVQEVAAADDAFVLMGVAFLFALATGQLEVGTVLVPEWASAGATLGTGIVLGAATAWLVARAPRHVEWWTLLLGAAWIATGATTRVGLSAMAATFAMGLTLSVASREAGALRTMVMSTEGPVLLPALLLAGAHLTLPKGTAESAIVGAAVAGRLVASYSAGTLLASVRPSTRRAAGWLGLGLLSSGTLTMMVAFATRLRFDGAVGRLALLTAAVGTLLGELVGTFALRRALASAGELGEREPAPEAPAAPEAAS
jgi:hypothetical protein